MFSFLKQYNKISPICASLEAHDDHEVIATLNIQGYCLQIPLFINDLTIFVTQHAYFIIIAKACLVMKNLLTFTLKEQNHSWIKKFRFQNRFTLEAELRCLPRAAKVSSIHFAFMQLQLLIYEALLCGFASNESFYSVAWRYGENTFALFVFHWFILF